MSKQATKQAISQFHITRQLGFKPILYCWCGAYIDTNKNSWQALRKFRQAHEGICEMPMPEQHQTPCYATYCRGKIG
jgi:hypothetical protein